MSNSTLSNPTSKPGALLWIVGIIALVWHGMGSMNLMMQLSPEMLVKMPESHQAIA